ncbi:MAG: nucleoside triphosphate pyrophosphohydrolase [Desulfobacterales bacterium]
MAPPHLDPPADAASAGSLAATVRLVDTLRGEKGCPWDRKQTTRSLSVYLIEEVFELVEAIESGSREAICEELGDVFFQIVFMARLLQEQGQFDLGEVIERNTEKMVRRHPHVFGNTTVADSAEVQKQWRRIKQKETLHTPRASILDGVPSGLPALMRAYRVSERAAGSGFDWEDLGGVMDKVEEEWEEFKTALGEAQAAPETRAAVAMEFGDLLFTLVNVARFAKIHPETALSSATEKFSRRFRQMEARITASRRSLDAVGRTELDRLWQQAKAATAGTAALSPAADSGQAPTTP